MKRICVFCSSSEKIRETYVEGASQLGKKLAEKKWGLVYGGSDCGLMRVLSEAVKREGGDVYGVITRRIAERAKIAEGISELIVTESMKERKSLMREKADAFIALPGGWGTLEEITEVITLKQLGEHNKPILFINTDGFYTPFFQFTDHARKEGFISNAYDNLFSVAETVEDAIRFIEEYTSTVVTDKY